jgi:hypothetical protein
MFALFASMTLGWFALLFRRRSVAHRIHWLMGALVALKAATLLAQVGWGAAGPWRPPAGLSARRPARARHPRRRALTTAAPTPPPPARPYSPHPQPLTGRHHGARGGHRRPRRLEHRLLWWGWAGGPGPGGMGGRADWEGPARGGAPFPLAPPTAPRLAPRPASPRPPRPPPPHPTPPPPPHPAPVFTSARALLFFSVVVLIGAGWSYMKVGRGGGGGVGWWGGSVMSAVALGV